MDFEDVSVALQFFNSSNIIEHDIKEFNNKNYYVECLNFHLFEVFLDFFSNVLIQRYVIFKITHQT